MLNGLHTERRERESEESHAASLAESKPISIPLSMVIASTSTDTLLSTTQITPSLPLPLYSSPGYV